METRRMCPHCRAFISTSDRTCPYCNESVAPAARAKSERPIIGGFIPHARFNTMMILFINFALFVACALYAMKGGRGNAMTVDMATGVDFGAVYRPYVASGQWWRLVTAGFIHWGLLHILMNCWTLFDLGAVTEEMFGAARMYVIYFVSTVTGFYVAYQFGGGIAAGASAALFGLIGAMIALGTRYRDSIGGAIRGLFVRWLIYGLLFSLLPGVSMAAHVGGLVGGFVVGYVAGEPRYQGSLTEKLWQGAAGLSVAITVFCFLKWYLWFSAS